MTRLETLISLALNARLRGQSLTLAPSDVELLCELLEELVALKSKIARPNAGRRRKHNFASEQERDAYYNAKRKGKPNAKQ